jgi:V8-like Glu-specific endopeptidase
VAKVFCFYFRDSQGANVRYEREIVSTNWITQNSAFAPAARNFVKMFRADFAPCNGILVSPKILLTARHLEAVSSDSYLRTTVISSAMQFNEIGTQINGLQSAIIASSLRIDGDLDLAFANIQTAMNQSTSVKIANTEPRVGDSVRIVSICPELPSCLTTDAGTITKVDSSTVSYSMPTAPGDSGAAILNSNGELIAIHSRGFFGDQVGTRVAANRIVWFENKLLKPANAVSKIATNQITNKFPELLNAALAVVKPGNHQRAIADLSNWLKATGLAKQDPQIVTTVFESSTKLFDKFHGNAIALKTNGNIDQKISGPLASFLQNTPLLKPKVGQTAKEAILNRYKFAVCWIIPASSLNLSIATGKVRTRPEASGIGFFVGDRYILTAKHNVIHASVLPNMIAYAVDQNKRFELDENFYFSSTADGIDNAFSYVYEGQDFVILKTKTPNAANKFAISTPKVPAKTDNIFSITIPIVSNGKPLAVGGYVLSNPGPFADKVLGVNPNFPFLAHYASTDNGDSGCPLVDETGQVVAIHTGRIGDSFNRGSLIRTIALNAKAQWSVEKDGLFATAVPGLAAAIT